MRHTSRPPWLGIELRHLAALSAIAREGSFRAAADRLDYVQSAISQQLAQLEQMVGARLVERKRGISPVALTDAGELLLHHFNEVLARISAAQADLDALKAGRAGRLRIGLNEWAPSRLVPPILVAFRRRLPGIEVRLEEARPAELAARMEAGELDLVLSDLPLPAGPFEAIEIMRDPYVLLVPTEWPAAADGRTPSLPDIARMPLIGHPASPAAARLDVELQACGVEPHYTLGSGSPMVVQSLVGAGLGAAIVPRLDVYEPDERTVAIELGELVGPRVLALYWHRERRHPSAFDSFKEVAMATCASWEEITHRAASVHGR